MTTPPKLMGTYQTPRFEYGDVIRCERRGNVEVVALSAGRIAWPIVRTLPSGRARSLVLFGGLAEAVRCESAEAVAYWFGVKGDTVWRWRKALDVLQSG